MELTDFEWSIRRYNKRARGIVLALSDNARGRFIIIKLFYMFIK